MIERGAMRQPDGSFGPQCPAYLLTTERLVRRCIWVPHDATVLHRVEIVEHIEWSDQPSARPAGVLPDEAPWSDAPAATVECNPDWLDKAP